MVRFDAALRVRSWREMKLAAFSPAGQSPPNGKQQQSSRY